MPISLITALAEQTTALPCFLPGEAVARGLCLPVSQATTPGTLGMSPRGEGTGEAAPLVHTACLGSSR